MKNYLLILLLMIRAGTDGQAQDFLWAKQISPTTINSNVSWPMISKDADDNIYMLGEYSGTADFDPGIGTDIHSTPAGGDYYIQKMDVNGNPVWLVQMTDDPGYIVPQHFVTDDSGNIYVVGFFENTVDFDFGPGVYNLTAYGITDDGFVVKLDSAGNFVWVKQVSGMQDEVMRCVAVDENSNLYIGGVFEGTVDFDPGAGIADLTSGGQYDVFVMKLDASGNFMWVEQQGTTGGDNVHTIVLDNSVNIYVSTQLGIALNIAKYDNAGANIWNKQITNGFAFGSITIKDAYLIITGLFNNTRDFDPGPGTYNLSAAGYSDIFVLRLDLSGNFVWVKQIGGPGQDGVFPALIASNDDIILIGGFHATCDFDPGPQQYALTAQTDINNNGDLFMLRLNSSGNFLWARRLGNTGVEYLGGCSLDNQGNIIITGSYRDTCDFDPGPNIYEMISPYYGSSAFILKLAGTTGLPYTALSKDHLQVYPNPSQGIFTITSASTINKVQVTDVLGMVVYSDEPGDNTCKVALQVAPGVYSVSVISEGAIKSQKILINY